LALSEYNVFIFTGLFKNENKSKVIAAIIAYIKYINFVYTRIDSSSSSIK